jgi:hypothetical protein
MGGAGRELPGVSPDPRRRLAERLGLVAATLAAIGGWWLFLGNRAPGDAWALVGFPLDDAWIHLVYARALATEGGFHYNPGVPEAGMTSPLWVLFAASAHLLAAPFGTATVVVATKALALLCGIGSVWALHALARALGLARPAALLVALLAAVDPALTFSRAAGMEMPLFTLLVLAALALALAGEVVACGVAAGLALVARPEGVLVLPSVAVLLALAPRRRGARGRDVAAAVAAAALPALLYAAFCLAATGRPLPNTFYAKFHGPGGSALAALALGWREYVRGAEPYFTLEAGTALALVGSAALLARRGARAAAVLGAGALLFAGALLTRSFSAGHFHYWERWLVPSYPFLLLALGAGVETVAAWIRGALRARWAGGGAAAALAALVVLPVPSALALRADEYAWNCRNIDELQVALGRWIAASVPPGEAVAAIDAGAIRYFGGRETVDLHGLNDHRIRSARGVEAQRDYLRARGVEWLVLVPTAARRAIDALGLEPVHEVVAPVYTVSGAPQERMAVYRWPRGLTAPP